MAYNPSTTEVVAVNVPYTAAGTTSINGTSVDLTAVPADIVRFTCILGTLTATQQTALKIQTSPDNSTWTDLTGSQTAYAGDSDGGKCLICEWVRPNTKWVRSVVVRGTANAIIGGVIMHLGNVRKVPITADTTVSAGTVVGPSY